MHANLVNLSNSSVAMKIRLRANRHAPPESTEPDDHTPQGYSSYAFGIDVQSNFYASQLKTSAIQVLMSEATIEHCLATCNTRAIHARVPRVSAFLWSHACLVLSSGKLSTEYVGEATSTCSHVKESSSTRRPRT